MLRRPSSRGRMLAASIFAVALLCRGNFVESAEAEQKIREALGKHTTMEFNETSLKDVVNYLKALHAINIMVDRKMLEEANVQMDTPITEVIKGVSLGSGLKLILEPVGLTYVIENEVLSITSPAGAQRSSVPRTYDVSALLANSEAASLLKAVELVLDRPANGDDGKPMPVASRLVIFRKKLILRGSQPEHDRVAELLLQLQEPAKPTAVEPSPPARAAATKDAATKEATASARSAKRESLGPRPIGH